MENSGHTGSPVLFKLRKNRQTNGDDFQMEIKEEDRPSWRQMEQSNRHLDKLKADGTELVTNVLVKCDARQMKRKVELRAANRLRVEKLENEAKSSTEKFNEIMSKWSEAETKVIHQELRDDLRKQQQLCWQIIEDKNRLLNELLQELKGRDNHFVKERKKEAEEVDLLIERMQEQISSLKKHYRKELEAVECSFHDEQKDLLSASTNKWEQQRKEQNDKELKFLMQRMDMVEEHEALLDRLRAENSEEYNQLKITLETDLQHLQQDLEERKAIYQSNQEKLEYDLQKVKKFEEECAVIKAQQIRKITRLQDTRNNLKKKCAIQEKQSQEEIQSLTNKYRRLIQQCKDIQKRIRHFAEVDAKRYEEIWLMNEDEAKALVGRAVDLDRVIHEQVLGLTWSPPPLPFTDKSNPQQPVDTAWLVTRQVLGEEDKTQDTQGESGRLGSPMGRMNCRAVKRLMELLCDEMGFLLERKCLELISSMEKNEQDFLKLDSICSVLGIENEEDVIEMTKFFLKYKQPQTEKDIGWNDMDLINGLQDVHISLYVIFFLWGYAEEEVYRTKPCTLEDLEAEIQEILSNILQTTHFSISVKNTAENKSNLIHSNDLLRALRAFHAQYCKTREKHRHRGSALGLERMTDSEVKTYWENIANVIPESKLKVWSVLEAGLKKYYTELTKRSKLLSETKQLKQQNSKLRMILKKYKKIKGKW